MRTEQWAVLCLLLAMVGMVLAVWGFGAAAVPVFRAGGGLGTEWATFCLVAGHVVGQGLAPVVVGVRPVRWQYGMDTNAQ